MKCFKYLLFSSLVVVFSVLSGCSLKKAGVKNSNVLSKEILLENLKGLANKGILFGHQDDLAYGHGWAYQPGNSDVKRVTGDYPAVYGWDLGHIELGSKLNIDSVPFKKINEYAVDVYKKGGINTFSWHQTNPFNGNSAWDSTKTIKHILNNPKVLSKYYNDLNKVASFFKALKDQNGNLIPIIFRPLHEQTGNWFWWGSDQATPKEFISLWQLTVDYLRKKGANNVLYAFSTTEFSSKEFYLQRYPGDAYVDILGFDAYQNNSPQTDADFVSRLKKMAKSLSQIGQEHHKLIALTEVGLEQLPNPNWWTDVLLPIVKDANFSYVLLWRNGRPDHYFVPYPGQVSENNFKTFYKNPKVLFQKELTEEKIYQKK